MQKWSEQVAELEKLLRLKTFPLAFKRCEKVAELETIPGVHRLKHHPTFCQILTLARTAGWNIGVTGEDVVSCPFPQRAGLIPRPEKEWKGRVGVWLNTLEDGEKCRDAFPTVPGTCEALSVGPLASESIEPEVILIYGSPAQMVMIMQGIHRVHYEKMEFSFIGESSCLDAIHRCYLSAKPSLSIPCYGERWIGGTEEDELDIALPPSMLATAIKGMKDLSSTGLSYPIHRMGSETDPGPAGIGRIYGPEGKKARAMGRSCWE